MRVFMLVALFLLSAVMIPAPMAHAAVPDIKVIPLGYDKGDPNTRKYRVCAGDPTATTKIIRIKLFPKDIITNSQFCLDTGVALDSVECNAQLGMTGKHLYECTVTDSDYMKGVNMNINGAAYIDGVVGVKQIKNDGQLVWSVMQPGIPQPPVCSWKSCQVCDNGQIVCP